MIFSYKDRNILPLEQQDPTLSISKQKSPESRQDQIFIGTSSLNELIECNLCAQDITKDLIYTNPNCSHTYCYLKKCPCQLDQASLREFFKRCVEAEEKPKRVSEFSGFEQNSQSTDLRVYQPSISELVECHLCRQNITKELVYTNPNCSHTYCFYCVQDLHPTHHNLTYCYLKKCPCQLDQASLRKFFKSCTEVQSDTETNEKDESKSKVISLRSVLSEFEQNFPNPTLNSLPNQPLRSELVECHICGQSITKELIYTNQNCKHNYCLYCVKDLHVTHYNLTYCYLKKCSCQLDQASLKEFLRRCIEAENQN